MRRNIFDIVNARVFPLLELGRIDELLHKEGGVYVVDELFSAFTKGKPLSIFDYVDEKLFKSWKHRGTCIDCEDFERTLDVAKFPQSDEEVTESFILLYCEYVANMVYLLKQKVHKGDELTDIVTVVEDNIKKFLGWYNYELKNFPNEEKVLVVPQNVAVTLVAENMKSDSLAYNIVEYNHYLLKGNMDRKKAILLAMGTDLEPRRKEIAEAHKKTEDCIFFLLNKLDIRHNNRKKGDKNYVEKVAKMRKPTLEKWYDELYALMLTAYMILDNKDRITKIQSLKSEII